MTLSYRTVFLYGTFLVLYYLFTEASENTLPLLVLCAGDCSSGGTGGVGGGTADNSGIGDPGGPGCSNGPDSDAEAASPGGSSSAGCASCAGSSGADCGNCGNCGSDCSNCSGGVSTPFLYVWRDGKYHLENDVMFGKPVNVFNSEIEGRMAYESGKIRADLYKITEHVDPVSRSLKFQLREIEPEESFVDYLGLTRVVYPRIGELLVDSTFKRVLVFAREELDNSNGVRSQTLNFSSKDISPLINTNLSEKIGDGKFSRTLVHLMESDDSFSIDGYVTKKDTPLFLVLGSNYRDWAIPAESIRQDPTVRNFFQVIRGIAASQRSLARVGLHVLAITVVFIPAWLFGVSFNLSGQLDNRNNNQDSSITLAGTFGVSTANADAPTRSFRVEYWDGRQYRFIDMVHPRYYKASFDAVSIPREAINEEGKVSLRVTATRRHNLTHASLVAPQQSLPYRVERCIPAKATLQRTAANYMKVLSEERSGKYLHTLPSDVVDIEFTLPETSVLASEKSDYLFQVGGYYTPLSLEGGREIGDWMSKLAPDSRVWLEEMASLKAS